MDMGIIGATHGSHTNLSHQFVTYPILQHRSVLLIDVEFSLTLRGARRFPAFSIRLREITSKIVSTFCPV
jgi:hypothetical protein